MAFPSNVSSNFATQLGDYHKFSEKTVCERTFSCSFMAQWHGGNFAKSSYVVGTHNLGI